jgi:hypothetical protein
VNPLDVFCHSNTVLELKSHISSKSYIRSPVASYQSLFQLTETQHAPARSRKPKGSLGGHLTDTVSSSSSIFEQCHATQNSRSSAKLQKYYGGTAVCCQATFAGDLPIIITLASVSHIPLNMNDVNCILGKSNAHLFLCQRLLTSVLLSNRASCSVLPRSQCVLSGRQCQYSSVPFYIYSES